MKKNKSIILTMAIATAMALTGCGSKEETKTTEQGKVEIESNATKADTTDSAEKDSNEDAGNEDSDNEGSKNEDTYNEDSDNEDSNDEDSDNEDSNDEDSDNEDSDDEDSDNEDSDDEDSDAEDSNNDGSKHVDSNGEEYEEDEWDDEELAKYAVRPKDPTIDVGTLKESTVVTYNGVTFSIGESEEEVIAKLGEQYAPSAEVPNCCSEGITEYYYSNMNIRSLNGVIILVEIFDNGYGGDIVPSIASGITLGTDFDTVEACYGVRVKNRHPKISGYSYEDNKYFVYFTGDYEEDGEGVEKIEMYDSNLIPNDN